MKRITDKQFDEYQALRKAAIMDGKLRSAHQIENLEDDIDKPIQKLVAIFALLSLPPLFSCCGFDYEGQPIHKTHERRPYIMFSRKYDSSDILADIESHKSIWKIYKRHAIVLQCDFDNNPDWDFPECIHYSENHRIYIANIEKYLIQRFSDRLVDVATLHDTNETYRPAGIDWLYPPKKPWVISREYVLGR